MKTDELIDNLSGSLVPVPRHALALRLGLGIGTGAVLAFILMWAWLGIRPDLAQAIETRAYWMKFGYTLGLAGFAFWASVRLSRPAAQAAAAFVGMGVVFAFLFGMSAMRLMQAPAASRMAMIMGSSADVCPWRIIVISVPVFLGTFWGLKAAAPTRLVQAGAVAGFASGALGAWIYAFHCDESSAPFVLVFYTLGISIAGAAGALVAKRVLRW